MPANIKDVAYRAGVSPSTVSRVIANHPRISRATRERVRAAMLELNYHPNAIARSLVLRSPHTVGLLIPSTLEEFFSNPFFPQVMLGIAHVAQESGYDIFLSTALHGLNDVDRLDQMCRSGRVDGVILLTSRKGDPLLRVIEDNEAPAVLIGRPAEPSRSLSWVNNDNRRAAYEAAAHLLSLGHRRIGFLGGSPELIVTLDRIAGYTDALKDFGVPFDPLLAVEANFLEEGGYTGMLRLLALPERPTAVVASDDVLAFGAMRAAGELGYRIPDDLAVVGFNDITLAKLANPPMTTMDVHIYELGQTAAEILIGRIQNPETPPRSEVVPHSLIIRRSCGARGPLDSYSARGGPG